MYVRFADPVRRSNSLGDATELISRIYVINLDRQPKRWHRVRKELRRLRTADGVAFDRLARRHSATDARHLPSELDEDCLIPEYTLADQLTVDPNPLLPIDAKARSHVIEMTREEIAVARSHIDVWRRIAGGDSNFTLVLEDDVYFAFGFARSLDIAWQQQSVRMQDEADLIYLSYLDVNEYDRRRWTRSAIEKAQVGLWYGSGYVLSKKGARRLLDLLPVRGPVDLWLNLQFENLNVVRTNRSIIEQRPDVSSSNSYSVMPVLTRLGVFNYDNPQIFRPPDLAGPIFCLGDPNTGLTSLATALAIIGYTCCSDVENLPESEAVRLRQGAEGLRFDAFVNVGDISEDSLVGLQQSYPCALFIHTSKESVIAGIDPEHWLHLPADRDDKWAALSEFLAIDYPSHAYPRFAELGQRSVVSRIAVEQPASTVLEHDESPWIIDSHGWNGICIVDESRTRSGMTSCSTMAWSSGHALPEGWAARDDTFPSNVALFDPLGVTCSASGDLELTLDKVSSPVREFRSAAIAAIRPTRYGRFAAEIRPSNTPGVITGFFLHRNAPRQEIDIEFMGDDPTSMLVNVYFNPGCEGTKLEYGYRGTPTRVDLGFDASKSFHYYEIEWAENSIRWIVDWKTVHERVQWDPTPIPDLPLELNINVWSSRSTELAGELDETSLPATTSIRSIEFASHVDEKLSNS